MERVLVPKKLKRTLLGEVSGRVVIVHPGELSLGNGPVDGDFILVMFRDYYLCIAAMCCGLKFKLCIPLLVIVNLSF